MGKTLVSTRDTSKKRISYTDALLAGMAPDGGLYTPTEYPQLSLENLTEMKNMPYPRLAFEVKKRLVGGAIPDEDLKMLLQNAYPKTKFNAESGNIVPVREIGDGLFLQNLSLGPTAAFKDMAFQVLGQEMNYELMKRGEDLVILGATSGDTGSAAEAALKGLETIKLFMLSPQTGMSAFQKAQMASLSGGNIFNIGIDGRFDDCQDLVKALKMDVEFSKLGAVNSINWGRISSQIPYIVSGYLQVAAKVGNEVDFAFPTGNFGNALSGYIARQMGVPIRRLIIATNENNVMDRLIRTGIYEVSPAQITSSPSMDISKASNYERFLFNIVDGNPDTVLKYMNELSEKGKVDFRDFGLNPDIFIRNNIFSGSSTHSDRLNTIKTVYNEAQVVIDPHTADAVIVAKQYEQKDGVPMVCMETALPVKFEDTVREALGFVPPRDERFQHLEEKVEEESFHNMPPDANQLKEYIRSKIQL